MEQGTERPLKPQTVEQKFRCSSFDKTRKIKNHFQGHVILTRSRVTDTVFVHVCLC